MVSFIVILSYIVKLIDSVGFVLVYNDRVVIVSIGEDLWYEVERSLFIYFYNKEKIVCKIGNYKE